MYKKITVMLTLVFTAVLFYVANKYYAVKEYKFAYPKDFVQNYVKAASVFQ